MMGAMQQPEPLSISPASGRLGVLTPGLGAVASTFIAGVLAGIVPAWRAASIQPARAIQEGG